MTADVRARLGAALADRYTIERELGAGGMATVDLAHLIKHGRDVLLFVKQTDELSRLVVTTNWSNLISQPRKQP